MRRVRQKNQVPVPDQTKSRKTAGKDNSKINYRKGEEMKTEVLFSSATDLWETPQEFFDELDKEFHFTVDVCATPENAKCAKYFTPEQDGLKQKWGGGASGAIPRMDEMSDCG
jgi:hypothetical protein